MQDVGVGLYPSMSLLNHSCDPNCVIIFEGYQLLLRSIREIQIGEELTISYIESLMPTSERQKQLKRQYCFECDCCLCQDQEKDAKKLAGEEPAWKEVKDAVNEVKYPKSKEEWEKVLAKCQHLLSSHTSHLPDTNIYQLKLLDCAMDACINLEAWEQALCYGSRTLGPYRLYYPDFHPLRAVQLMRVGKLQYSQGMLPQALGTLKQKPLSGVMCLQNTGSLTSHLKLYITVGVFFFPWTTCCFKKCQAHSCVLPTVLC
uniref:[histone H3]-lysine(4) N-trimethyltransferase n=1 Tax=Gallus gallus TaxID=9031 RepID=A0A8V0XZB4_CHICK